MDINVNLTVRGRVDLVLLQEAPGALKPEAAPAAPKPEAAPEAAPKPEAAPEEIRTQILHAMGRARCRIEGEDWETNTASEGYQAYHRKLNGLFKATAERIAGCKPSEIDDPFKARLFCEACDYMKVGDDGKIVEDKSVAGLMAKVDGDESELPF